MEFKGTKGKWTIGVVPEYNTSLKSAMLEVHSNSSSYWICKIQNKGMIEEEEGLANALLISKAPEMLEMLQYLWSQDLLKDKQDEVYELIKQATEV